MGFSLSEKPIFLYYEVNIWTTSDSLKKLWITLFQAYCYEVSTKKLYTLLQKICGILNLHDRCMPISA